MKCKILLSTLSFCLLYSDIAFGSRKEKAFIQSASKPKTLSSTQALKARDQISLMDLPDISVNKELNVILDVLLDSTDPKAVAAIGIFAQLSDNLQRQHQTEALNETLSGRNVQLSKKVTELETQLEELKQKQAKFKSEITIKSEEAKAKNDQLKKDNERLQTQLGEEKKKQTEFERKLQERSVTEQKQFEEQIAQAQTELARLKATLEQGALTQIDQLTGENKNLQVQIEKLKKEHEEIIKKMEENKQQVEGELQRKIRQLTESREAIRINAEEHKKTMQQQQAEIGVLKKMKENEPKNTLHIIYESTKKTGIGLYTKLFPSPVITIDPNVLAERVSEPSSELSEASVNFFNIFPFLDKEGHAADLILSIKKIDIGLVNPKPVTPEELKFIRFFFENREKTDCKIIRERFCKSCSGNDRFLISDNKGSLALWAVLIEDGHKVMREIFKLNASSEVFKFGPPVPLESAESDTISNRLSSNSFCTDSVQKIIFSPEESLFISTYYSQKTMEQRTKFLRDNKQKFPKFCQTITSFDSTTLAFKTNDGKVIEILDPFNVADSMN